MPGSAAGSTHDMEGTSAVTREVGGEEGQGGDKEQQQQQPTATTSDTKAKDSPKRR